MPYIWNVGGLTGFPHSAGQSASRVECALPGDNFELLGLGGGCAPQLRAAQYSRFRVDAPHRAEVPSEAVAHRLKDLRRRFRDRRGVRQDARDTVLHKQALLGAPALGYID